MWPLPNCQLEQVGYTVPLNSGQAELAVPRLQKEAPLEAIPVLSPWDSKIISSPFPDSGLKTVGMGLRRPSSAELPRKRSTRNDLMRGELIFAS